MTGDDHMNNSSILIPGGGSGIGLGIATLLVRSGAHVTICGRTESRLAEATDTLNADTAGTDGTARYVVADMTSEDDVQRAVTEATAVTGRLNGVATTAGGSETVSPVTQIDTEAWKKSLDLNLTGTMLTLKYAARELVRGGGGSFVAISSIASSNTHRWFGAYGVVKSGVDHLCQLAADELGASNVRVNAIRPGLIETSLVSVITDRLDGGALLDDYQKSTPLPRIGNVADVAALTRFLLGSQSTWITGQVINVDGGQMLRRGPDFTSLLEQVYGHDGLRGVVAD